MHGLVLTTVAAGLQEFCLRDRPREERFLQTVFSGQVSGDARPSQRCSHKEICSAQTVCHCASTNCFSATCCCDERVPVTARNFSDLYMCCITVLSCATKMSLHVRARLVADPAIGVADLEGCLKKFLSLNGDSNKEINLYKFVLPPSGTTWKSAPSVPWLVELAPLLDNYLCIAANGVLPGKKHKAALLSLDKAMKLNDTGKNGDQWADVIDDSIRMALSHLRQLAIYDSAKVRAFKKMDVSQQQVLQRLLDKILVPEAKEGSPALALKKSSSDLEDSQAQIVPASPEPASTASTPAKASGEPLLDATPVNQESDPATIFNRILQETDSDPSVKSLRPPEPSNEFIRGSPERGFLGALLKQEEGLSAEDVRVLQGYEARKPPEKVSSNSKARVGKPKAKAKSKAAPANGKAAAKAATKSAAKSAAGTSNKKEGEPNKVEEAQVTKRKRKPDSELTRTQLRARVVSRAYHRTLDEALANGRTKETGKKLARAAHAKAAEEFDAAHPREARQMTKPLSEVAEKGQD